MARRILLGAIGILTLVLASCFPVEPTRAVDIHCIDASKYKYLLQMFENNQQKFTEFLKVSPSQLPAPEMCRAILITGAIGSLAATKTSDVLRELDRDVDRLLNVIAMNNGWVAEIYLASPGGNLWNGMFLGQLARTFWLKTVAVGDGFFEYVPDFVALTIASPGPDEAVTRTSELDWKAYSTATRGFSHIRLQSGQALCASSCASLLVGGVDRRGITYVHRVRVVRTPPRTLIPEVLPLPKGQTLEGFSLALDLAYLQHMDAGIDMIRATQSTPANKLSPARAPRFPSLISDLLISQCDAKVDELEKQETNIRAALRKAAAKGGNREAAQRLRNELTSVGRQRAKLEVCIATIHESKRLAQFAKYCSGRNCDRGAVSEEIRRQLSAAISRPMAEQGFATAQYNLGVLYANGQGIPQDYVEAVKWFRLAADQGEPHAQYALGLMYVNGDGLPRDYVRAHMWLNLSATKETKNANLRDFVAERMSSEQIAEAEKLAREWKPTKQPR